MALLICLGSGAAAWGGPFAQVPGSDRAYSDWAFLAQRQLVAPPERPISARQPITRTEFAQAILPLGQALAGVEASPGETAGLRRLLAKLGPDEVAQVIVRMTSLLRQFEPELKLMGLEVEAALAGAKRLEATQPVRVEHPVAVDGGAAFAEDTSSDPTTAGLRYRVLGAELGMTYAHRSPDRAPLLFLPTWVLTDLPDDPPVTNRLAARPLRDTYGSRELTVRSVRGSVEYDLTHSLSLGLAYETLLEGDDGITPREDASLKTVGLGYRLSPSTSLRLRYYLLDYRERLASTSRQRDQAAETELVIRF